MDAELGVDWEARFWSKVAKRESHECWPWLGGKNRGGYGQFYYQRYPVLAHRFSYELTYGRFDEKKQVNHTCDNPSCTNPQHLYLGTQGDNNRDRLRRRRGGGNTRLSSEAVEEIKQSKLSSIELANRFGISRSYVWSLRTGMYRREG